LCLGRVSIYDKQGKYQLYVQAMEPKGAGALQLAFEQLKAKLEKEGLFDEARKRPIPFLPRAIGIVTSQTGAAIRDMLNILRRRFPNVEIILNPVKVQGEGASTEIASAIKEFNEYGKVDVLIVGRGGGSIEDLWPFNEEIVARAIYNSKIPVVSAVGHEVDFTISDFVADLRAPTPSAAAELVVPEKDELRAIVAKNSKRLANGLLNMALQLRQRIDDLGSGLAVRVGHMLQVSAGEVKTLSGRLRALSPLAVLERGYSITFNESDGKIVKNAATLKYGNRVETRVHKGRITSVVDKITD
jgi:exodeoxyribonuclease VII large subunit